MSNKKVKEVIGQASRLKYIVDHRETHGRHIIKKVTQNISPKSCLDIGAGKGEKIATTVYGGEVGIIFDCRNRPISVSDDSQTRVQELKRWSDALNEYPTKAE